MKLKSLVASSALLAGLSVSSISSAADFDVTVTNLTRGVYFTPLLVAAHPAGSSLFTSGQAASASLQAMAEGGDISGLSSDLAGLNATVVENPAAGLLGPGQSTTATLNTDSATDNTQLSVVSMLLPTNDGFLGLNAITVPSEPGTYTYNVAGYDAGTEANDEIRGSGAPGEPGYPAPGPVDESSGMNGTGISGATAEGFVHIHRNVLGDTDSLGGASDIDSAVHRWLNPVARVTLVVR